MAKSKAIRWNERLLFEKLAGKFPAPAYTLLPQVRNSTGFGRRPRTIDALAISNYPSRGLYAAGFEMKVTLHDWRKELAEPEKAEEIQRFCRYWYAVAPKGVIPVDEIPQTWGLLEADGRGLHTTKAAPELGCPDPTWGFVASVLRKAAEGSVPQMLVSKQLADLRAELADDVRKAAEAESELRRFKAIEKAVKAFEQASGIRIGDTWRAGHIGQSVAMVQRLQLSPEKPLKQAEYLKSTAEGVAKQMAGMIEVLREDGSAGNET
jgi:hypothetical protein